MIQSFLKVLSETFTENFHIFTKQDLIFLQLVHVFHLLLLRPTLRGVTDMLLDQSPIFFPLDVMLLLL